MSSHQIKEAIKKKSIVVSVFGALVTWGKSSMVLAELCLTDRTKDRVRIKLVALFFRSNFLLFYKDDVTEYVM